MIDIDTTGPMANGFSREWTERESYKKAEEEAHAGMQKILAKKILADKKRLEEESKPPSS